MALHKKFRVLVNGKNFIIEMEGEGLQRMGFFTTRFVEASSPEHAENTAVDMIRTKLSQAVKNLPEDPPLMFVDELEELSEFPSNTKAGTGFSFYPDDEENN